MRKYDVCCIGNPLLDFIVDVDDDFLDSLGLTKGGMHLVDQEQAVQIMSMVEDKEILVAPGGSASNVAAGVAALGGKSFFTGCIGYDENGKVYQDMCELQVSSCYFVRKGAPTGCAITFITPDGERTFATFLEAALELEEDDINQGIIEDSKILHIAGFLLEDEQQKKAVLKAFETAKYTSTLISIDLADSMYLEEHNEEVKDIVEKYADFVFANQREAEVMFGCSAEEAVFELAEICEVAVVTLGPKGSLIVKDGKLTRIEAVKTDIVNTNGAGDMYDAAFLFGMAKGYDVEKAGKLASFAASKVVASESARVTENIDLSGFK